jgi:hypothetical protein
MSKKPYMWGKLEWLEFSRKLDWINPVTNPDDLAKYSELQRPYALGDGLDDYAQWENSWPDINFPDIPDIIVPDPLEDPCSVKDSCTFMKINGPGTMECGGSVPYTALWVTLGCEMPPGWAIFSSWSLSGGDGECVLIPGLVIARIVCSSVASPQTLTLTVEGPYGCSDSLQVIVSCDECCEEFTLTGNSTVNNGELWTGTISPACPGVECNVTSNSGCSIGCSVNDAGSQVLVTPSPGTCGSFTVTVTDAGEGCDPNSANKVVRINDQGQGGTWEEVTSSGDPQCGGPCSTGCGLWYGGPCIDNGTGYKYGRFSSDNGNCFFKYYRSCIGCRHRVGGGDCPEQEVGNKPACTGMNSCVADGIQSGGCGGTAGPHRDCTCSKWVSQTCEWKCEC